MSWMAYELAAAILAPVLATTIESTPMRGPFARVGDFCRELEKDGLLRCAKPDGGDAPTREPRGAQGQKILEARAIPIQKERGGAHSNEIAIVIRTNGGWFVDVGNAPARATRTDGVRIDGATAKVNWLDAIGSAVLSVSVTRTGEARRITRQGGEIVETTTSRTEVDRRFCGFDAAGVPSCTDELLVLAEGNLDADWATFVAAFYFDSRSGRFRVGTDAS